MPVESSMPVLPDGTGEENPRAEVICSTERPHNKNQISALVDRFNPANWFNELRDIKITLDDVEIIDM